MFRKHLLIAAIITATTQFVATASVAQNTSTPSEFNSAVKQFQQFSQRGDWKKSEPHARQAYEIGLSLFSEDTQKTATLAHNYGFTLLQLNRRDKANQILQEALSLHEQAYGPKGDELVPVLIDLASSLTRAKDLREKNRVLQRAMQITELAHGKQSAIWGQRAVEVGVKLQDKVNLKASHKLIEQGYETLLKALGPDSDHVDYAAFQLGKTELALGKNKAAIQYLESALQGSLKKQAPEPEFELAVRELLAKALILTGKGDEAASHIMTVVEHSSNRTRPNPKLLVEYPLRGPAKADKDGYVIVNFSVNEQGLVSDAKVVERDGPPQLAKAALRTIQEFRYIPAVAEGKPVAVSEQSHRFNYKAPKASSAALSSGGDGGGDGGE